MRIITGSAKGTRLETLEGEMTRPTSEKVKEAISALQVLGYNRKEIEKAFEKLPTMEMSTEELIRKGLVALGK